jgi:hypothetical protein
MVEAVTGGDFRRGIRRAIIDDNDLQRFVLLCAHAFDGLRQKTSAIERSNDDAY